MTFLKWREGKPYLYRSVRDGMKVTSVYEMSYADHLRKGGKPFPVTKRMSPAQIRMLIRISRNIGTYLELRRQKQKVAFKPYNTRYYAPWRKEFGLS